LRTVEILQARFEYRACYSATRVLGEGFGDQPSGEQANARDEAAGARGVARIRVAVHVPEVRLLHEPDLHLEPDDEDDESRERGGIRYEQRQAGRCRRCRDCRRAIGRRAQEVPLR